LKNKTDFYIAFYERLALQGFQAYIPTDKDHLANICINGYNIAHFTKTDHIIANPYAEGVDAGTIEKICEIARNTALKFGICTEKPYDETNNEQLPDNSYKLAEVDGTVLSCSHHPLLGYVFSVFKRSPESGQDGERQQFYNKDDARRGFAISSGLVDGNQFFTEKGLSVIYDTLMKQLMTPDNGFDSQATQKAEYILAQVEDIMQALGGFDFSHGLECFDSSFGLDEDADLSKGVEP